MLKLVIFLSLLFAPVIASAHPGHEHVGSEASHHLAEYALIAVASMLVLWAIKSFRTTRASRRDS